MAKATTKIDLFKAANDNFKKMWMKIDFLTPKQQEQNFTYNKDELTIKDEALHWKRDNNLRDVLIHLYEWHQLVLDWVSSNENGVGKPFLPEPYTWTTYPKMNIAFFEKHQNTPYEKSKQMVKESHKQVLALIEKYSDQELFQKKHFGWTGTTSLGQYFHSATVAHYEWAIKKLKAYQKSLIASELKENR